MELKQGVHHSHTRSYYQQMNNELLQNRRWHGGDGGIEDRGMMYSNENDKTTDIE